MPDWLTAEQVEAAQESAGQVIDNADDSTPVYLTTAEAYQVVGATAVANDPVLSPFNGSGRSIAILDSGADLDHPAFGTSTNGVANRIVHYQDFWSMDGNDANDYQGHGTAVAGVAAGLAPGVNLVILKVTDNSGTPYWTAIEEALRWIVREGARDYNIAAVNLSVSDGGNHTTYTTNPTLDSHGLLDDINMLAAMGVTTVAGVGNNYTTNSTQGVGYPAVIPVVIGVGATWDATASGPWSLYSATDNVIYADKIAAYSQRHSTLMDIVAPGSVLTVPVNNGGYFTNAHGTSYSAPQVTAAVAIANQMYRTFGGTGNLLPNDIDALLTQTGTAVVDAQRSPDDDNVPNTGLQFPRLNVKAMAYKLYKPNAPDLKSESDWGFSEFDNITANKTPTFIGTAPAGSFVQLYVGDTVPAGSQQLAAGVTNYSVQVPANHATFQNPGNHFLTVKVAESSQTLGTNPSLASNSQMITLNHNATETLNPVTSPFGVRLSDTLKVSGTNTTGTSSLAVNWAATPLALTKAGAGTITIGANGVSDRTVPVTYVNNAGTTNFNENTGTSNNASATNWTVVVDGTSNASNVVFNTQLQNLAKLEIKQNGLATIAFTNPEIPQGQTEIPYKVLYVRDLVIAGTPTQPTGKLDITNNVLIWDYSGASPAQDKVRKWIIAARGAVGVGNATWAGMGITSGTAATYRTTRTVAYADNSTLPLGQYPSFKGQTVDSTTIIVRYTKIGDTNLDGVVNDDDVTVQGIKYGPGVTGRDFWSYGDLDYNGFVDDDDVTLLGTFYNPSFDIDVNATPQNP